MHNITAKRLAEQILKDAQADTITRNALAGIRDDVISIILEGIQIPEDTLPPEPIPREIKLLILSLQANGIYSKGTYDRDIWRSLWKKQQETTQLATTEASK